MKEKEDAGNISKEEMYAILLKEFEDLPDEGRELYLEEVLAEMRKDLEEEE